MRLLRLTIRGLRSFARETEVDLERLGAAGLFAIVGPTGAGKSTVLDGIFLALFGRSPRGEAGECVSAGALSLAVRLEIEIERWGQPSVVAVERRFRWSKKRDPGEGGVGTELRGSSRHLPLRIEEPREGGWAPVDLGGQKADDYLREQIVRVSMADFQQAVVLPQGEIDALLRARPAERRTLLASLFRTEHLGQPLVEELRMRERSVRGEIDRLDEAEREVQVSADEVAEAEASAELAKKEAAERARSLGEAEVIAVEQRRAWQRCAARDAARAALSAVELRSAQMEPERARLDAGRRAALVEAELADLSRERGEEPGRFLNDLVGDDVDGVDVQRIEERLGALRVHEEERTEALAALSLGELGAAITRRDRLVSAERRARTERVRGAEGELARALDLEEQAARKVEERSALLALALAEVERAESELDAASSALAAVELRAAAAVIAQDLQGGDPCPVCGSIEHPGVDRGNVTKAIELHAEARVIARRRVEAAKKSRDAVAREQRVADQERSALTARKERIQTELDVAGSALARLLSGEERPSSWIDAEAEIERHRARAELALAMLPEGTRDRVRARAEGETLAFAEARSVALTERAREAERLERLLRRARDRLAVTRLIVRGGFEGLPAFRAARMPARELSALEGALDALTDERRRLRAILDERARDAAIEVTEDEARAAEQARDEALARAEQAREEASRAVFRSEEIARRRLRALELQARAAVLEPRAHRLAMIQKVVAGNQLAELAAERHLEAVTRGAAVLLRTLSSDRYALIRGPGGAFAVTDAAHGGLARTPSTLSGGETFLVSLALSLALSERIQIAGRTRFDFFFLDEGFGTLDAATLEVALDALSRLRASNRVIGMISHVPALEERMPSTLRVMPARPGGSATVRHETR